MAQQVTREMAQKRLDETITDLKKRGSEYHHTASEKGYCRLDYHVAKYADAARKAKYPVCIRIFNNLWEKGRYVDIKPLQDGPGDRHAFEAELEAMWLPFKFDFEGERPS